MASLECWGEWGMVDERNGANCMFVNKGKETLM